jgi:hypothetical protein
MGTGYLPGVKLSGNGADHPPHIAPRLKKKYTYTSTPPLGLRGLLQGELYLYLYWMYVTGWPNIVAAKSPEKDLPVFS